MRLSVLVSAIIAAIIANASAAEGAEPAGWCEWLPWTCETRRTPSRPDSMMERVECRMRRIRYCCNSDPPVSATSCPGPRTTGRRRRDRGGEHWARRGGSPSMECPVNREINYGTFPTSRKVDACAAKYPKPDAGHTTVWCPWEYWGAWNYRSTAYGLCKRVRTRDRRCACASRSWFDFGETSCRSSSANTEKQEQSVKCNIPETHLPTTHSIPANPEIIVDYYYPRSPIPIVLGCLALLVVLAVAVTIGIVCSARCKRKRAAAAAAASSSDRPATSFSSRLASSFRRGSGIVAPAPSAPAYGSAAFFNAGVPVPTVSLKVSDSRVGLRDGPPPPYSSQPELPRGAVGGPSGSSSQHPPPPYSPQPLQTETEKSL